MHMKCLDKSVGSLTHICNALRTSNGSEHLTFIYFFTTFAGDFFFLVIVMDVTQVHKKELHFMKSITFILLMFIICEIQALDVNKTAGKNLSSEILVESGENVTIDCIISNDQLLMLRSFTHYMINVTWKWRPEHKHLNWTKLQDKDGWQKKFYKPRQKLNNNILTSLELRNVTVENGGVYGCFLDNTEIPVYHVNIKVTSMKSPATYRISCKTNGMLTVMKCCVTGGEDTFLNTTFFARYSLRQKEQGLIRHSTFTKAFEENTNVAQCKQHLLPFGNMSSICCPIIITLNDLANSTDSPSAYLIAIMGQNKLGLFKLVDISEYPFMWVTTDPPNDVRLTKYGRNQGRSTKILISWSKPKVNPVLMLEYKIRYRESSAVQGESWHIEYRISKTSRIIGNLRSGTAYDVQVASGPGWQGRFRGTYGDWSNVTSFSTDPDVPMTEFRFRSIAVKRSSSSCQIQVTWFPYKGYGSSGFFYQLNIGHFKQQVFLIQNTYMNWKKFDCNLTKINITGSICNTLGCSKSKRELVTFREHVNPIKHVNVAVDNGNVTVTWETPSQLTPDENCNVHLCKVSRSSYSFVETMKHTLSNDFNRGDASKRACEMNEGKKYQVPCSNGELLIFGLNQPPCIVYLVKVLRKYHHRMQTIYVLSDPSFLTQSYSGQYRNISLSASNFLGNVQQSILLKWNGSLPCQLNHMFAVVMYVPISGAEYRAKNCSKSEKTIVQRICSSLNRTAKKSEETVKGLYGGTTYNFGLAYCCQLRNTCFPASNIITFTTAVRAPSVPVNVSWRFDNPKIIEWLKPEHPNGPLDGYHVQYRIYSINKNASEIWNATVDRNYFEMPHSCKQLAKFGYLLRISAFNYGANQTRLMGCYVGFSGIDCPFFHDDKPNDYEHLEALIIGLTLCVFVMVISAVLCHFCRKRIKQAIRKTLWPPVPEPKLMVTFNANPSNNEESDALQYLPVDQNDYYRTPNSDNIHFNHELVDELHNEQLESLLLGSNDLQNIQDNSEQRQNLLHGKDSTWERVNNSCLSRPIWTAACLAPNVAQQPVTQNNSRTLHDDESDFTTYSIVSTVPSPLDKISESQWTETCKFRRSLTSSLLVQADDPHHTTNQQRLTRSSSDSQLINYNSLLYLRYSTEQQENLQSSSTFTNSYNHSETPQYQSDQRDSSVENRCSASCTDGQYSSFSFTGIEDECYVLAPSTVLLSRSRSISQDSIDQIYTMVRKKSDVVGDDMSLNQGVDYVTMDQALDMKEGRSTPSSSNSFHLLPTLDSDMLSTEVNHSSFVSLDECNQQQQSESPLLVNSAENEMAYVTMNEATLLEGEI